MSAPLRAARARLRVPSAHHRQHIETAFTELAAANDALLAATSGLYAALRQDMITHIDVYELLRVVHLRLAQTIANAEHAALQAEETA